MQSNIWGTAEQGGGYAGQQNANRSGMDTPLIAAADETVDTSKLAHNLQQSFEPKWRIFESHQAEWVVGQRSLSQSIAGATGPLGASSVGNLAENTCQAY